MRLPLAVFAFLHLESISGRVTGKVLTEGTNMLMRIFYMLRMVCLRRTESRRC